jgi:vacuole morphology and inheritance protein 14
MNAPGTSSAPYERPAGRLKTREDSAIRWVELLDKFKSVQEKSRRSRRSSQRQVDPDGNAMPHSSIAAAVAAAAAADQNGGREKSAPDMPKVGAGGGAIGSAAGGLGAGGAGVVSKPTLVQPESGGNGTQKPGSAGHKARSTLSNFGRLTSGIGQRRSKR